MLSRLAIRRTASANGVEVVDGHVGEALDLRSVQVHGDDPVDAGDLRTSG
jgi:hypothetical protein